MEGWLEERVPSLGSTRRTVFQVSVSAAQEALKPEWAQHEEAGVLERWEWVKGRGHRQGDGGNRFHLEIGLVGVSMTLVGDPEFSKAQSCHRTPTHSATHSLNHPPTQVGSSWRLRSLRQVALALAFPGSQSLGRGRRAAASGAMCTW